MPPKVTPTARVPAAKGTPTGVPTAPGTRVPGRPAGGTETPSEPVTRVTRRTSARPGRASRPGRRPSTSSTSSTSSYHGMIKAEFIIGLIIIGLSPWIDSLPLSVEKGQPISKNTENWVKRMIAWTLIFTVLLPMSYTPRAGKFASGLGGLMVLTMLLAPVTGETIYAKKFLDTISKMLTIQKSGSSHNYQDFENQYFGQLNAAPVAPQPGAPPLPLPGTLNPPSPTTIQG